MDKKELLKIKDGLCGIYKITSPNNRVYIGQSINIKNRYRAHIKDFHLYETKLSRSFKKYGTESHKFEILCECDKLELGELETHYIHKYNSLEEGLNTIDRNYTLMNTSKCKNNYEWTDERKKNHSEFMKKQWKNNYDYKRGDDWKYKLSESRRGKVTAKNENGEYVVVSVDEYKSNPNLVGTTANVKQPKLYKKVRCITDDVIFESVKAAAKYYEFPSSGNIVLSIKNKKPIGVIKHKRELFFEYV
jgi:group I intron endonuclease